jgi:sialic acid synthase SpsE
MCELISDPDRLDFPTRGEKDMMLRHNRRLIVTKDLNTGDALEYGKNFGAYRSLVDDTRGLSPFAYKQVDGKRMGKGISKGTAIGPGDFK